jgi:hypothetical protein
VCKNEARSLKFEDRERAQRVRANSPFLSRATRAELAACPDGVHRDIASLFSCQRTFAPSPSELYPPSSANLNGGGRRTANKKPGVERRAILSTVADRVAQCSTRSSWYP